MPDHARDVTAINVAFDYFNFTTLPAIYAIRDQIAASLQTIIGLESSATSAKSQAVAAQEGAEAVQGAADTASGVATTNASAATTQASIATTQADVATTQAGIATTKAGEAAASEANALTYKSQTEAARDQALDAFSNFLDKYLGEAATDPTTDLDGSPLDGGELYFNTPSNAMMVYTGSAWVNAYVNADGVLLLASNLADL